MNRKRFLSGIWPVVQRELRESARRRVNHRLRFWGGLAGALLLWLVVANSRSPAAQLGSWLLGSLHALLLGLILLIVPGLMADSIAREKRDGTLGLLFLTPLSAGGVVAGKAMVQGLRAFSLWLAVLPILVIPFLTGGVNWFDALSACSLEFSAAVLCLAAGLLASTFARERNTAFLLALIFAVTFQILYSLAFGFFLFGMWRGLGSFVKGPQWELVVLTSQIMSGLFSARGFTGWSMLPLVSTRLADIWKGLCWTSPLVALLIFYGMARLAARRIERSWIDQPPTLRQVERFQRFCTPLFRRRFQHKMRRTLEWNPIAWLQQYSWKAGAAKWGLCLAVIVIERLVAFSVRDGSAFLTAQVLLLAVLGSVYIFVGVNSFLEEKRSGALELLLVTPIPVNTIIFGRMWGLWKQFGPAALVVTAAVGFQMRTLETRGVLPYPTPILFTPFGRLVVFCNFLTLPVFATYAALRVKNLLAAAGLTLIGAMLPLAFARNAAIWAHCGPQDFACLLTIALGYGGFAALACFLLRHSLSRRIYSF